MAGNAPADMVTCIIRLPVWTANRRSRPSWWWDDEVRDSAIRLHAQMGLEEARAVMRERHGKDRAPSRGSLRRFWLRLDAINGRGH